MKSIHLSVLLYCLLVVVGCTKAKPTESVDDRSQDTEESGVRALAPPHADSLKLGVAPEPEKSQKTQLLEPPSGERSSPKKPGVDEGVGRTPDEALRDAFRNSVSRVVGVYVDAETRLKNEEIISDQVLTYSEGFIESYEVVGTSKADGLHHVRVRAVVSRRDVVSRLKAAKVSVKNVDGQGLFAEAVTTLEAERAGARMLRRILGDYPANVLKVEVVSKPRIIGKTDRQVTISYDVRVAVDKARYDQLMKRVVPLLEQVSV
ncbi:MAG TPA: hypothetical protein VMI06_08180, partial [Terriglobia bacterium]|nr:hypothetical protein [Terriglobia bacterium]